MVIEGTFRYERSSPVGIDWYSLLAADTICDLLFRPISDIIQYFLKDDLTFTSGVQRRLCI